jgi:hypothetical protein
MSDNLKFAQLQPFTLAGAGANIGDSTIILTSMETIDGVALAMTDFGTIGFGTLEPGNGVQEEQISFSGITQNSNGTATLTGVKTVLMLAPYTQTANLAKTHAGGTTFVISNTAGFYDSMTSKSNDEEISGLYTFVQLPVAKTDITPTNNKQLVPKKYVDDTAIAGSPDMNLTTKGIAEEATADEIDLGTQTGVTGAELAVNPKFLKDSIYYTRLPSADQKAALAGSGTPSAANKFVTADTDALKELLANKKTTSTLSENSDTYYPSQKAVKTYVDTSIPNANYYPNSNAGDTYFTTTVGHNTSIWTYGGTSSAKFYANGYNLVDISGSYAYTTEGISHAATSPLQFNAKIFKIRQLFWKEQISAGTSPLAGSDKSGWVGVGTGLPTAADYTDITATSVHRAGFAFYNGRIYTLTCNGSAVTTNDISADVANTPYDLTIGYTGSSYVFYINGTLVATHTTNLPTTGSVKFGDCFYNAAGSGAAIFISDLILSIQR